LAEKLCVVYTVTSIVRSRNVTDGTTEHEGLR